MSLQRVSQRDVAKSAHVHFTTVSLALRNSPALPEKTRLRIQKLAREMGYRPDPMLTALQAYRKTVKASPFAGAIAWINSYKQPRDLYKGRFVQIYREAAQQRCEELGYRLEDFNLAEVGPARLSRILQARGIQGLLLPPQPRSHSHLKFDWENFSAVSFGFSLSHPRLHTVVNAQYRSSRLSVRELRKYGYRRIGFVSSRVIEERTDHNFSSGFLTEQRREKAADQIPILTLDDPDFAEQKRAFRRWYQKHRPAAIVTIYPHVSDFMQEQHISYEECGLGLLILDAATAGEFAGIDQNDHIIGSSAVDFLVGMIHRNERGIPETPLRILVEGRWVDGKSVVRQNISRATRAVSLT
jgi:LacI family repressor for deo operon, udp, cdd, tsx, nupC, and nupG